MYISTIISHARKAPLASAVMRWACDHVPLFLIKNINLSRPEIESESWWNRNQSDCFELVVLSPPKVSKCNDLFWNAWNFRLSDIMLRRTGTHYDAGIRLCGSHDADNKRNLGIFPIGADDMPNLLIHLSCARDNVCLAEANHSEGSFSLSH